MSKKVTYIWIILIVLIAAWVRLWQLGQMPPSPDWDEAALGYNAYSVLKTGRDEYGTRFPLTLRSFDDYKPPLYMYLTIPSVALFGLTTWSVRLPSAIAGILAVIGTYFLVKEFYKRYNNYKDYSPYIPFLSALLLAISPWHIQFSRIAFEANIGVTINIWAVWAFLKGLQQRKMLAVSAFLFGLGLYAYHSERIFVPLLVLLLSWVYRKELLQQKRSVLMAVIFGVLTVAPLLTVFLNPTTIMRLRGTSSLADQTGLLARGVRKLEEDQRNGNPWGVVFDNRRIVWTKTLVTGYLSHYSLKWLFLTGDNARHHAPDMGLLYLAELPFLLWGMFALARSGGRAAKVVFGWFLIAPIAASPTTELPHAIRTLVFLPTFQIFTAVGLITYARFPESKLPRFRESNSAEGGARKSCNYKDYILRFSVIALFALNFLYYLHMYFGHLNQEYSASWQYGYREAVEYARTHKDRYKKIVVSTKLEQPHMFFLYFLKYDPVTYLAEGGTSSGGFAEVRNKFDIYEFRPIHWDTEIKDGTTLYIGTPSEISGSGLMTIRYLDGKDAMKIAD